MNKTILLLTITLILFGNVLNAQTITSNPSIPIVTQPVTITFDATKGDAGLNNYTGDIYAHTGVITDKSSSSSDWKYVKADWSINTTACKLTQLATNSYQLIITPSIREFYGVPANEKILKIAFVFRNSNGTKTGRDAGGKDVFTDVFENTLNVKFAQPSGKLNFYNEAQTINIEANAASNDSICLFIDNQKIKSVMGQKLTHSITAHGQKLHTLIASAYSGTQVMNDTTLFIVPGTPQNASIPANIRDGINYINNQTVTLAIFAPFKNNIYLIGDFNNWQPDSAYQLKKDNDRWWITLTGLTPGKEYAFQYLMDGNLRIADPYTDKTLDPNDIYINSSTYPNLPSYPSSRTTDIISVFQTAQTPFNWQVPNFTPPPKEKLIIYEILIRDFTANRNIKTITDTLPYLKKLGINAIELMPFNEFEGNDSWGYNPSFYFAPDKAYGTKTDFKRFVDECHRNGIAVIQDLVLNHSYGQSPLVRMYMDGGKPSWQNPWYNQVSNMQNPDAQWGFDFNHQSPYTQKLVDSIASYWMNEYKMDGFRYDFTKGFTNTPYGPTSWASDYDASRIGILKRMASQIWKRKPNAYVIFEHLAVNSEEKELADFGIMLWGNLNGAYNQATMGFNDNGKSDFSYISYTNRSWSNPNLVGYMESHDEERLMFKNLTYGNSYNSYNIKNLITALKRMELAACFFYSVPGPKMLWQFGELGYDISIDQGGRLSQKPLLWNYFSVLERKHLFDINQALITWKKNEPIFSTSNFSMDVAGTVKQISLNSNDSMVRIVGNFDVTDKSATISFPQTGKWYELFRGDSISVTNTSYYLTLKAGEYRLFSNKKLAGFGSIPTSIKTSVIQKDLAIFPNPFHSILNWETHEMIKSVELKNLHGETIMHFVSPSNNKINTLELPNGIYFISILFKNGDIYTLKVIKY